MENVVINYRYPLYSYTIPVGLHVMGQSNTRVSLVPHGSVQWEMLSLCWLADCSLLVLQVTNCY